MLLPTRNSMKPRTCTQLDFPKTMLHQDCKRPRPDTMACSDSCCGDQDKAFKGFRPPFTLFFKMASPAEQLRRRVAEHDNALTRSPVWEICEVTRGQLKSPINPSTPIPTNPCVTAGGASAPWLPTIALRVSYECHAPARENLLRIPWTP